MSIVKLETFRGDAADLLCVIKGNDITNWAIRCEVWDNTSGTPVAGTTYFRKATANVSGGSNAEILITDAANGLFTIYIASGDTTNLGKDVQIEIQVTDTNGNNFTVLKSSITLKAQRITWSDADG